jgi:hypothetical protein
MRLDDLRQQLHAIAADAPSASSDPRAAVRPAIRRLWMRRVLAGVSALVVVLGSVFAISRARDDHTGSSIISRPDPSTRGLSATTIGDGRWSAMALAPVAARNNAAVVWADTQLIVWGGDDGQHVFDDGAAYNPETDSWRRLPPAPIVARTMASAVWTGHELIIWGGDRKYLGDYAADGAAFDPSTWSWRSIAAAPLAPRYSAEMIWTGHDVIVMGGAESNTDTVTSVLDAAAYDPLTNRWHVIAPLLGVANATIESLRFVWTGSDLLVWELWRRMEPALTTFGLQLIAYDPNTDTWRLGPPSDDPHRNVASPVWTGDIVVVPATPPLCDLPDGAENCGESGRSNLHGNQFDPETGVWRPISQGPVDDATGASVWTGDTLVVFSGLVVFTPGETSVAPSPAAAWNPRTNSWTELPPVRLVAPAQTAIWTGYEILLWSSEGGRRYGLPSTTSPTAPTAAATTKPTARPKAISLPAVAQIPDMKVATTASFPWGSGIGSVGFRPSNDQADDGAGPAVSSVDDGGNVYVFDQANWRIVVRRATETSYALAAPAEAIYAAVFDAQNRLIVAGLEHFMVFAKDGRLERRYQRSSVANLAERQFLSLQVRGPDVVGYANDGECVVLSDRGTGYLLPDTENCVPAAVQIDVHPPSDETLTLTVSASPDVAVFDVDGPDKIIYVPATRVLPDGSIVAVLRLDLGEQFVSPDAPAWYVLTRLRPDGSAQFAKFAASSANMSNPSGPVIVADDNAVSVLSGSSATGVKVAQYRYADLPN